MVSSLTLAMGEEITFVGQLELFNDACLNLGPELAGDEMLVGPLESVFLGSITMDMAGAPVGIGTAGGLLVSGLITGYLLALP